MRGGRSYAAQPPVRRATPRHSFGAASASGAHTAAQIRSGIADAAWRGSPRCFRIDAIAWQPRYRGPWGRQTGSFASPPFDGFALFHSGSILVPIAIGITREIAGKPATDSHFLKPATCGG